MVWEAKGIKEKNKRSKARLRSTDHKQKLQTSTPHWRLHLNFKQRDATPRNYTK
jgi:hypothetical protein